MDGIPTTREERIAFFASALGLDPADIKRNVERDERIKAHARSTWEGRSQGILCKPAEVGTSVPLTKGKLGRKVQRGSLSDKRGD